MSENTKYHNNPRGNETGPTTTAHMYFAQRFNDDTTTNLNGAGIPVPIDGDMETNGTGWAQSGNGIQLTGREAWVRCSASVMVETDSPRTNISIKLALNGTVLTRGPVGASAYTRFLQGHDEASCHITPIWVFMTPGDIITVVSDQEANAGSVTQHDAGTSILLLERLVNV